MLNPSQPTTQPSVSFLPNTGQAPSNAQLSNPSAVENPMMPSEQPAEMQGGDIVKNLTEHLDQLPDRDKAFLAEHLTPEFVRAIGLINGPEVAQYLNQFADPNKVLVPVPRQMAEQHLAQQQGAPAQGQPPMAQPQAAPQPGGSMSPQATATLPVR